MNIALFLSLLSALAVMLISLTGIVFTWKQFGSWLNKNLFYLVSFSSGVFFVVALGLISESLHLIENPYITTAYIALGAIIVWGISFLFPEGHHHHSDEHCDDSHSSKGARRLLVGDSVHNIADGALLVPAFIVDIKLGLATAFGILVHEFVQEVSEFFVLKSAGFSNKKALMWNFFTSSTILLGVILGYILISTEGIIGPLLGVAAGMFLYTVLVDLVPSSLKGGKKTIVAAGLIVLGVLAIVGINTLAEGEEGHSHGIGEIHNEDDHHEEEEHTGEDGHEKDIHDDNEEYHEEEHGDDDDH